MFYLHAYAPAVQGAASARPEGSCCTTCKSWRRRIEWSAEWWWTQYGRGDGVGHRKAGNIDIINVDEANWLAIAILRKMRMSVYNLGIHRLAMNSRLLQVSLEKIDDVVLEGRRTVFTFACLLCVQIKPVENWNGGRWLSASLNTKGVRSN